MRKNRLGGRIFLRSALTPSQLLTLLALACAFTTTILARRHCKIGAWLRRLFVGLDVCALAAVLITWTTSLYITYPLVSVMLAGVAWPTLAFR